MIRNDIEVESLLRVEVDNVAPESARAILMREQHHSDSEGIEGWER